MEKAKEDMSAHMQSADANPMAALQDFRGGPGGGWQADLNQCGVDTNAIMNEMRPKIQEFMLKVKKNFEIY